MSGSISFNPLLTSVASGSFNVSATGGVQGTFMDDPAARYALKGGYLASTETLPMWGGVGISTAVPQPYGGSTSIPLSGQSETYGLSVTRATSVAAATLAQQPVPGILTGFTVFNQAHAMYQTPQSPVPTQGVGGTVSLFMLKSGARIWVAADPALTDLETYLTGSLVSWDFVGQQLAPYVASYPANVFTALTRAATGAGGTYVATATTTSSHGVAVGDVFGVSGCVPAAYNGSWIAAAGTTGSTLVWNLGTTTDPGAETTLGTLVAGGGALACSILKIESGNSYTVNYAGGNATWNRSGTCALIQI